MLQILPWPNAHHSWPQAPLVLSPQITANAHPTQDSSLGPHSLAVAVPEVAHYRQGQALSRGSAEAALCSGAAHPHRDIPRGHVYLEAAPVN